MTCCSRNSVSGRVKYADVEVKMTERVTALLINRRYTLPRISITSMLQVDPLEDGAGARAFKPD